MAGTQQGGAGGGVASVSPAWASVPKPLNGDPVTGTDLPWFWLGTHQVHHLALANVPLFVSRRRLTRLRPQAWPSAAAPWAMDSGGFTEIKEHGDWLLTPRQYVDIVRRAADTIGNLAWVAPMDWMCEPFMVEKVARTGAAAARLRRSASRGVLDHQVLTVRNYLELKELLDRPGDPHLIPVLQGWTADEYLTCVDLYDMAGVNLSQEPLVGVGSVCRRSAETAILYNLAWLGDCGIKAAHGFGLKGSALTLAAHRLASCDSLAWSYTARARRRPVIPGHTHAHCGNCLEAALAWRQRLLDGTQRNVSAIHAGLAEVQSWIDNGTWQATVTVDGS